MPHWALSRCMKLLLVGCLLLAACSFAAHGQTANKPVGFTHVHSTLLPVASGSSGQNNLLSTPPPALYDEQLGETFTQDFTAISYNVTALSQVDSDGYGPGYLLNGLSNDGYWYQVGIGFDWPHSNGGYNQGFYLLYDVFNSAGNVVYPSGGGGGMKSFSGTVNSGDSVLLNLYFNNGFVWMYSRDWNTGATAYVTYGNSHSAKFVGLPSTTSNQNGFFTGLMTEWYHADPYYGDESAVTYSDCGFGLSSAWMWMDEWAPGSSWSGTWSYQTPTVVTYSSNPTQLQSLSYNGANDFSNAYDYISGSIGTQVTSITLAPSGFSTPLSCTNEFSVSYVLNGQPQVTFAQSGTLTLFSDAGTDVTLSGVSTGSISTGSLQDGNLTVDEWVLNSQGNCVKIAAGSTVTLYYFELLNQQVGYFCGLQPSSNPILTYCTAPQTASSQPDPTATVMFLPYSSQQTIFVQKGTTLSITDVAGAAQDQWATPTLSWSISQPNQIYTDIPYYHQYQVTANFTTSDGSAPTNAPDTIGNTIRLQCPTASCPGKSNILAGREYTMVIIHRHSGAILD